MVNTTRTLYSKEGQQGQQSTTTTSGTTGGTTGEFPQSITEPLLVAYRSVGIGIYGVAMRFMGMPLEKIALYMNSSQVFLGNSNNNNNNNNRGQFRQAIQLTFRDGALAPYRVVGPASVTAWFFQYSVMGFAFQFFDQTLSQALNVRPVYYGAELMEPAAPSRPALTSTSTSTSRTSTSSTSSSTTQTDDDDEEEEDSLQYHLKSTFKMLLAPILSAGLETMVSNRAEVQRYYGKEQFAAIDRGIVGRSVWSKAAGVGMAFTPNFLRNQIMCQTTFLLTPITYKLYFPQEHKNPTTLFWYGLGMNVFVGNAVAITQQALWGRSLDSLAVQAQAQQRAAAAAVAAAAGAGAAASSASSSSVASSLKIDYAQVIRQGLTNEGMGAFFTLPKWSSRVLMNAPAQGILPWFYNEILPLGEESVLKALTFVWTAYHYYEDDQDEQHQEQEDDDLLLLLAKQVVVAPETSYINHHHTTSEHDNDDDDDEGRKLMILLLPRATQVLSTSSSSSSSSSSPSSCCVTKSADEPAARMTGADY